MIVMAGAWAAILDLRMRVPLWKDRRGELEEASASDDFLK
jgi:hypothetical protein